MKESFLPPVLVSQGSPPILQTLTKRLATFRQVKRYLADATLPLHGSVPGLVSTSGQTSLVPAVYVQD